MLLTKLKLGGVLLLVVSLATAAAGWGTSAGLFASPAEDDLPKQRPPAAQVERARTDRYGDPLPAGAIERVGTLRFRLGGGAVTDLLLGAGGKALVSNTFHGAAAVQVWEPTTGKLLR